MKTFLGVMVIVLSIMGCAHNGKSTVPTITTDMQADKPVENPELLPDITLGDATRIANHVIYFGYNTDTLSPEGAAVADRITQMLTSNPAMTIRVEGNTCDLGTSEYNLALGERRALAVRRYMISHGAPAGRIITLSYGEENPAMPGESESDRAKNRRAEFSTIATDR